MDLTTIEKEKSEELNQINTSEKTEIQINEQNQSLNNFDNSNILEIKQQSFEEKSNTLGITERDLDALKNKLIALEIQIDQEHNTLIHSSTYKNMVAKTSKFLQDDNNNDNNEENKNLEEQNKKKKDNSLIKDGSTITTIRCHELLNNTKNAIKLCLSQISPEQINEKNWKEAISLSTNGSIIQLDMTDRLKKITTLENRSEDEINNAEGTINNLCSQLLSYSSWGNSTYFKNVIKAIKNFQKLPAKAKTADATDTLYAALNTYIQIRSKSGKKKNYKWPSGAKRVELADKLKEALESNYIISNKMFTADVQASADEIKKLSIDKIQTNINERVNKMAGNTHPDIIEEERAAKDRYGEIYHLIITKDMLKPSYVRSHIEEFQKYIRLINKCKEDLDADTQYQSSSKLYQLYFDQAKILYGKYKYLENYVELCNDKNSTADDLTDARSAIQAWDGDPKYIDSAKTYYNYLEEQIKCQSIILDNFKNIEKDPLKQISSDEDRFQALIKPWKTNKDGTPATDEDMKIYKENLRLFSTMYLGNSDEYLIAAKEFIESFLTNYCFQDKDMNKKSWGKNWQMKIKSLIWINIQNILTARKDKDFISEFSQMFPELADKLRDFQTVSAPLSSAFELFFHYKVGDIFCGNSFNNYETIAQYPEEFGEKVENHYRTAQQAYKQLKKKYGDIL